MHNMLQIQLQHFWRQHGMHGSDELEWLTHHGSQDKLLWILMV